MPPTTPRPVESYDYPEARSLVRPDVGVQPRFRYVIGFAMRDTARQMVDRCDEARNELLVVKPLSEAIAA